MGDRSYLVHDGRVAFVIDPQRDIDRVLDLARTAGVRITHIFETHIHNDYVTGGLALARETGAAYHVNADDPVAYQRTGVRDGDVIDVSPALRVRVLATPGHTYTHLSYVLEEHGTATAVFSGGSLLFGSTGRPDLLGPDHTHDLVHHQYASAQRLAAELPDQTRVMPTHGFGSFCSATQSEATASTIGVEKTTNPVLTQDEQRYVTELLAGLDAFPAYYAQMGPANTAGPSAPDLSPPAPADAQQLRRRLEQGEWLVDLRTRTAFAAGHAPGTLNFGLDGSFATYLGWLIPWGTPVTLLGETAEQVAQAQREMVRIGIDRPAAAATGGPEDWTDGPLRTVRTGHLRRPRPRPAPPPRRRAGRAAPPGMGRVAHRRHRAHPAARIAAADRGGPRRGAVGALRRRLPGLDRRVDPAGQGAPGHRRRRRLHQRGRGRPAHHLRSGPDGTGR